MSKTRNLSLSLDDAREKYASGDDRQRAVLEELFGKEVFLLDPIERIKSLDDLYAVMGVSPSDYKTESADPIVIASVAAANIMLLADFFNRATGQKVDWSNGSQVKWYPVYTTDASAASGWSLGDVDNWHSYTDAGARLGFLQEEDLRACIEKFEDVFLKFYTL